MLQGTVKVFYGGGVVGRSGVLAATVFYGSKNWFC
jgi:hypothetical protein